MKTKLALILGIICIAVSAVTLFSVFGHADDSSTSTLTFTNISAEGVPASIKGVSLLNNDPRFLRLDISPTKFPKAGELSMVFIRFSDEYEASVARDLLMKQRWDLVTSYVLGIATNTSPLRTIYFVNGEGQFISDSAPQAALIYPADVHKNDTSLFPTTLKDLVKKEVRAKQLNEGVYVGAYGKIMSAWDSFSCQGKAYEKDLCHDGKGYPIH